MKPSQSTAARESRLFRRAWMEASNAPKKARPATRYGQMRASDSSQCIVDDTFMAQVAVMQALTGRTSYTSPHFLGETTGCATRITRPSDREIAATLQELRPRHSRGQNPTDKSCRFCSNPAPADQKVVPNAF